MELTENYVSDIVILKLIKKLTPLILVPLYFVDFISKPPFLFYWSFDI